MLICLGNRYRDRSGQAWRIVDVAPLDPPHAYPPRVFLGQGPSGSAWFMPDGAWSATGRPTAIDLLELTP